MWRFPGACMRGRRLVGFLRGKRGSGKDEIGPGREDLHDLAVVVERGDEEPIGLEQMKRQLKEEGLL